MANSVKTCQSEASRKELIESISPTAARDLDGLSGWLWPVSWTGERKQQRNRFATLVSLQCVGYGGRGSARPTVSSFAQTSWVMIVTFQQLDSDGLITRIRMSTGNLWYGTNPETSEFQVLPGNHRPHLDSCRHHNASVARRLSLRFHFGYIGLLCAWLLLMKFPKRIVCLGMHGRMIGSPYMWATFTSPWPIWRCATSIRWLSSPFATP